MTKITKFSQFMNFQDKELVEFIGRVIDIKKKKNVVFLVVEDPLINPDSVQCVYIRDNCGATASAQVGLPIFTKNSILKICGRINYLDSGSFVKACSVEKLDIVINSIEVIDLSINKLPITNSDRIVLHEDSSQNNTDSTSTNQDNKILLKSRLDNRVLDLRRNENKFIFEVKSHIMKAARNFFDNNGFIEINTPKIISTASEGGSSVFKLNYFGKDAYLAQSPQLYKQMAILAGFDRVYEIGSVFRAENSNTHRHLTEFIGIDMEMIIHQNYGEVLDVLIALFLHIFNSLQIFDNDVKNFWNENGIPPIRLPRCVSQIPIITFKEAINLLNGKELSDTSLPNRFDDLTTAEEKLLGKIMREIYGYDFYVIEKYPTSVRPFYTMPCEIDQNYSNSYDFFIRGEEVLSGAQRIHNHDKLLASCVAKNVNPQTIKDYIDSFRYGSYPHGGGGIGLERFVMLYLGLDNIRNTSMFPRDPIRLRP